MKLVKRITALMLSLIFVLSMLPPTALADGSPQVPATFSKNLNMSFNLGVNGGEYAQPLDTVINGGYTQNNGKPLGKINIAGSTSNIGTLTFPNGLTFGSNILAGDLHGLFFTPTPHAVGVVSYNVTAYDTDQTNIGTASLTITVFDKPAIKNDITASVYVGSTKTFSISDFTSNCNTNGSDITNIDLNIPATSAGTWYIDGTAAALPISTSVLSPGNVTHTLSFKGTSVGQATLSWHVKNTAGAADTVGNCTVSVTTANLALSSNTSASSLIRGSNYQFSTSDFSYIPSAATVSFLKIVSIPQSTDGYLCLTNSLAQDSTQGYSSITANQPLSAGAIIPYSYIGYLQLVSKADGTSPSLSFSWTATTDSNASTATWVSAASFTAYFKTGGTVSYTTPQNVPINLNATDFYNAVTYSAGFTLSYITFSSSGTSGKCGQLMCNYNTSTKSGTAVSSSVQYYYSASPNISSITFVPNTDSSGTFSIPYSAYSYSGAFVTGTLNITVANCAGGTVSYTIDKNSKIQLDASDFSKAFNNSTGGTLSYVRFSLPSNDNGRLYYNYVSSSNYDSTVSPYTNYYVYSSLYLSYVTFAGAAGYTGTVVVSYTAYKTDGTAYDGKLIIFIVDSPAGIITYNTGANGTVKLSGSDFFNEFIKVTGCAMSYVMFSTPSDNAGNLYYKYVKNKKSGNKQVSSDKYYYGSDPDISDITFVANSKFTGETVIKYTVYSESGKSFDGKLKIEANSGDSGTISFSTSLNTALQLSAVNICSQFYSSTSAPLSYVTFTTPDATYGTLYYGYSSSYSQGSAVDSYTKYYVSSSPYLSNIVFVPRTGYAGTFICSYTGYTANGTAYPGKIQITVGVSGGNLYYSTGLSQPVIFSVSDFYQACSSMIGGTLSYVQFVLPSSSYGILYYNYSSPSYYGYQVSPSNTFYYNGYPNLSNIAFVPYNGYTGTFSFQYISHNTAGATFTGSIIIDVSASNGGEVDYVTDNQTPVVLNSADFNTVFNKQTGTDLNCVSFTTIPSSTYGQLYSDYISPTSYSSAINTYNKYFRTNSPLLSNVSFVPNQTYHGKVVIPYIAYSANMTQYSGVLNITVLGPNENPFSDVDNNYSWASDAIKYLFKSSVVKGSNDGLFNPGNSMTRGDFLLMVCRAFKITASSTDNFSDVQSGSYYFDAIAACKALGIAKGNSGKFYPNDPISRQDAMVLIIRAMSIKGSSLGTGSSDIISGYTDQNDVSDYAVNSVASLVGAGYVHGSGGKLNPRNMISRAETAVILYNVLKK